MELADSSTEVINCDSSCGAGGGGRQEACGVQSGVIANASCLLCGSDAGYAYSVGGAAFVDLLALSAHL